MDALMYRVAIRVTIRLVIVGFRHKGLQRLHVKGSTRGLHSDHVKKLRRILAALDAAAGPADLALPSFRLHRLKGDREGQWSIWVNGNWRVIFRFDGDDVTDVDYIDYH
jgi:proteic killer suppression protein